MLFWAARISRIAVAFMLVSVSASSQSLENDTALATLAEWMTGSFSSEQQALEDTDFYDIRLEMARIWSGRTDGYWIYVEQAVSTHLSEPYRQRVYRVTRLDDSTFESAVFTFADPLRFAGQFADKQPLASLTPDSLTEKAGCSVYLKRVNETEFAGGTSVGDCGSSLRGAAYAVSDVTVRRDVLISWDRGYDADGNQVWGARTGGYTFRKTLTQK